MPGPRLFAHHQCTGQKHMVFSYAKRVIITAESVPTVLHAVMHDKPHCALRARAVFIRPSDLSLVLRDQFVAVSVTLT
jgi:hypothetical protein